MKFKPGLQFPPDEITVVDETGQFRRGINWNLTPEEDRQVREGYRCLHCMEPFEAAFPDKCSLCGFHVKSQQSFEYVRGKQGDLAAGPSPAMKALDEEREREAFRARSGIWVPGDPI